MKIRRFVTDTTVPGNKGPKRETDKIKTMTRMKTDADKRDRIIGTADAVGSSFAPWNLALIILA